MNQNTPSYSKSLTFHLSSHEFTILEVNSVSFQPPTVSWSRAASRPKFKASNLNLSCICAALLYFKKTVFLSTSPKYFCRFSQQQTYRVADLCKAWDEFTDLMYWSRKKMELLMILVSHEIKLLIFHFRSTIFPVVNSNIQANWNLVLLSDI